MPIWAYEISPLLRALLMVVVIEISVIGLMIVINDKPFFGSVSVSADPYKLILERLIQLSH